MFRLIFAYLAGIVSAIICGGNYLQSWHNFGIFMICLVVALPIGAIIDYGIQSFFDN